MVCMQVVMSQELETLGNSMVTGKVKCWQIYGCVVVMIGYKRTDMHAYILYYIYVDREIGMCRQIDIKRTFVEICLLVSGLCHQ